MKTTTIYRAYEKAREYIQVMPKYRKADKRHMNQIKRQRDYFRTRLLSRIEQGDRAREVLRQVEWVWGNFDGEYKAVCPWCMGFTNYDGHKPDCPRQLALGIEP